MASFFYVKGAACLNILEGLDDLTVVGMRAATLLWVPAATKRSTAARGLTG